MLAPGPFGAPEGNHRRADPGALWRSAIRRDIMGSANATRVLLVDDDTGMLKSMAAVLSDHFEVRTCSSPLDALRLIERESFEVVCLDWRMPEMDGIEFFGALERKLGDRTPCCILVTGHAAELLDQLSLESKKMLGLLRKPFSPRELVERVSLFANLSRMKSSNSRLKAVMKGTT
jgi:DNA-binding response OmpR family regulator